MPIHPEVKRLEERKGDGSCKRLLFIILHDWKNNGKPYVGQQPKICPNCKAQKVEPVVKY